MSFYMLCSASFYIICLFNCFSVSNESSEFPIELSVPHSVDFVSVVN